MRPVARAMPEGLFPPLSPTGAVAGGSVGGLTVVAAICAKVYGLSGEIVKAQKWPRANRSRPVGCLPVLCSCSYGLFRRGFLRHGAKLTFQAERSAFTEDDAVFLRSIHNNGIIGDKLAE